MRFYNPTPREYESTYVDQKLPYDLMLQAGLSKEKDIDNKISEIDALNKLLQYENLGVDDPEVTKHREFIKSKIDSLKEITPTQLTDPSTSRKIIDTRNELQDFHTSTSKVYKDRKDRASKLIEEIDKEKEGNLKTYKMNQVYDYFDPSKNETFGARYENPYKYNPVKQLDELNYLNNQKRLKDILGEKLDQMESDKQAFTGKFGSQGLGDYSTLHTTKITNEFINQSKAFKGLYDTATDLDYIKSVILDRTGGNIFPEQLQQLAEQEAATNVIKNKDGYYEFNRANESGREIQEAIDRKVFNKQDKFTDITKDKVGEEKAIEETLTNPPVVSLVTGGIVNNGNLNFDKKSDGTYDLFKITNPKEYNPTQEWAGIKIIDKIQDKDGNVKYKVQENKTGKPVFLQEADIINKYRERAAKLGLDVYRRNADGTIIRDANNKGEYKDFNQLFSELENMSSLEYSNVAIPTQENIYANMNSDLIDSGLLDLATNKEGFSLKDIKNQSSGYQDSEGYQELGKLKNASITEIDFGDKKPRLIVSLIDDEGKHINESISMRNHNLEKDLQDVSSLSNDITNFYNLDRNLTQAELRKPISTVVDPYGNKTVVIAKPKNNVEVSNSELVPYELEFKTFDKKGNEILSYSNLADYKQQRAGFELNKLYNNKRYKAK